jgi:fructose-bisphosphate aldolase, class II
MDYTLPVPGKLMLEALKNEKCIVMACNIRIAATSRGIMQAAKELDAAVIFEIAKSEIGYTGQPPQVFVDTIVKNAKDLDYNQPYVIHGDHIGVKSPDAKDVDAAAELIKEQISAGFTSYAIDASHNFDMDAPTVSEQLRDNIAITTKLCELIPGDASLEVEVGEVGKKDPNTGETALTSVEEAETFIKAVKEAGYNPDLLATNNGTSHGNIYDKEGNVMAKVGIDIERTTAIANAIQPYGVRIAQHGTTGTPMEYMGKLIDAGILKANVGTNWQNIALQTMPDELVKKMEEWTLQSDFAAKAKVRKPNITELEIIGKNIKNSIKVFKQEIDALSGSELAKIDAAVKESAIQYFTAFNAQGTATKVRNHMEGIA